MSEQPNTRGERRTRVLWLIKQLGPGGAERVLVSLALARDQEAYEVETAYVTNWNQALAPELAATGIPVHCLDVRSGVDPRWPLRLARLVWQGRFDIVHAHSALVAGVARAVVRAMPPRRRPALVTTEHADWSSYHWATRLLNRATLRWEDAHLAVSGAARKALPKACAELTEVVPLGVPVDELRALRRYRDAVRRELEVGDGDVLVVTVANLTEEKDHPNLMRAARTVIDQHPHTRFVVAGEGPMRARLERLHHKLELGDDFTLLGFRDDAVRLIAGADLFALGSRYEGYPVAVMEALTIGAPVVATAVGGIPDAVRNGSEGLIVPPRDSEALAQAISALVVDADLRRKMSANALTRSAAFDAKNAAAVVESVYERLVPRSGERRAESSEPSR